MSNTGRKEPMVGATVFVGNEAYTTGTGGEVEITVNNSGTFEVYAIKLDKDSNYKGYCFPLPSRTERVQVRVSVPGTGSGPSGDLGKAVDQTEKVVNDPNATEDKVTGAVAVAAVSLSSAAEKVQTENEAA